MVKKRSVERRGAGVTKNVELALHSTSAVNSSAALTPPPAPKKRRSTDTSLWATPPISKRSKTVGHAHGARTEDASKDGLTNANHATNAQAERSTTPVGSPPPGAMQLHICHKSFDWDAPTLSPEDHQRIVKERKQEREMAEDAEGNDSDIDEALKPESANVLKSASPGKRSKRNSRRRSFASPNTKVVQWLSGEDKAKPHNVSNNTDASEIAPTSRTKQHGPKCNSKVSASKKSVSKKSVSKKSVSKKSATGAGSTARKQRPAVRKTKGGSHVNADVDAKRSGNVGWPPKLTGLMRSEFMLAHQKARGVRREPMRSQGKPLPFLVSK